MTDLLAAALAYATRGTVIIPCAGKIPIGANWQHRVSNDPEQVRRWWREYPNANIGLIPLSAGLIALDIDSEAAEAVAMRLGAFSEPAPTVATGRRALPSSDPKYFPRAQHRYFRAPAGLEFTRVLLDTVLDVRRTGCQNLLPPSVHPDSGMIYTWEDKSPAGELPPALLDAIRAAVAPRISSPPREPIADKILEGSRDQVLTSLAGALRRVGATASHIRTALDALNREHVQPPLADRDLDRIALSVGRYPPAVPTSAPTTEMPTPVMARPLRESRRGGLGV